MMLKRGYTCNYSSAIEFVYVVEIGASSKAGMRHLEESNLSQVYFWFGDG